MATFKILVVDDEPGIRSGTRRILQNFVVDYPFMDEQIDFQPLEASSGEEALDIIQKEHPDIVLLDNKLPGIQGIEVLEYIKKNQYDIVVVMITSYASLELAVKATRDGAYDFIPKPFTPQELRTSLENITKQLFLRRMTQMLNKEGKQIRFQFLSVLSHELKAPLNAIEGYLHIIKEKQLGSNLADYSQLIDRSCERIKGMRSLIMDLLDLTKIESGVPTQKLSSFNLNKIIESSIDTFRPFAIQKDIDVYLNAPGSITMKADPDEIEIIINNLLSNAIKYNKEGGRVDCSLHQSSHEILFEITDTGIGMEPDDISKLFKEFSRIKSPKTRHITGSGLGLSIIKKIVEMYNGEIKVNSIPDKGTTFSITFPQ